MEGEQVTTDQDVQEQSASKIAAGLKPSDAAPPEPRKDAPAATPEAVKTPPDAQDELSRLRAENAAFKAKNDMTEQRRKDEDSVNDFIRENSEQFSPKLLRKVLPITSDRNVLMKSLVELGDMLDVTVAHDIKRGRLKSLLTNIGGVNNEGGMSVPEVVEQMEREKKSPVELITAGLKPDPNYGYSQKTR